MEKIELQKKLEKKKAYLKCLIVFLSLAMPSLLSICREFKLPTYFQAVLVLGFVLVLFMIYRKLKSIRNSIKNF